MLPAPYPVSVPVAVSCLRQPVAGPSWQEDILRQEASPPERLKAILADHLASRAYIDELLPILRACE